MARPKKVKDCCEITESDMNEALEYKEKELIEQPKLPQLINCTKSGHPIQYNLEPRFEAIQANFEALWKQING
jgi:predicted MarR family transcription regulator